MTLLAGLGVLSVGCYSGIDGATNGEDPTRAPGDGVNAADDDDDDDAPADPIPESTAEMVGETGLRRLTAAEYAATVRDLLGVEVDAALLLPEDWRQPFDNDFTTQVASQALIEGAELLASDVAAAALATPAMRTATVGCDPTTPTDEVCFRSFLETFGRRALRRPLTEDELDRFATLIAEAGDSGDFYAAVDVAIRALLQHPAFLYRVELGQPVEGQDEVFALDDYEIATRLSYFIWGSTPSDTLLDLAGEGALSTGDEILAAAEEMLLDERARDRVGRFHALWLGYETLPHSADLSAAMQAETQALLDRVIFEDDAPWNDLLRSTDTFIDPTLATHYGLTAPGGSEWVDYGDSGRQGLLSHGTFLSAMGKIDDSSPTKRGILVRTRLMCGVIPPPPPEVDVDNTEPPEGACKDEFYRTIHSQGSCAGCHDQVDPIGLGLENYDHTGAFRTVENENPNCEIPGTGHVDGVEFSGPAELSNVLIESGTLDRCVAKQLYRFVSGKSELTTFDERFVNYVVEDIEDGGELQFAHSVLRFVSADAFRYRRNETEGED